jgi:hypothetical protein
VSSKPKRKEGKKEAAQQSQKSLHFQVVDAGGVRDEGASPLLSFSFSLL